MAGIMQCHSSVTPACRFLELDICRWAFAVTMGVSALTFTMPLHAQARAGYTVTEYARLDNPGASKLIRQINTAGEVVGAFRPSSRVASKALIFRATGTSEIVGDQGIGYSAAYGINDQGEVVGAFNTKVSLRPFRAVGNNGFQPLDLLPGSNGGIAYGINVEGEAAGYVSGPDGIQPVWWTRSGAVHLLPSAPNVTTRALGLNGSGDIVGVSGDDISSAVLWAKKGSIVNLGTLPGFTHSEAVSINESGVIAGVATGVGQFSNRSRAVIWGLAGQAAQDLGVLPGGDSSRARDINARGEVVGTSTSADGNRAFIWTAATGMLDLNTLITVPGLVITDALGINSRGDIVVAGHDAVQGTSAGIDAHEEHEQPLRITILSPRQ